MITKIIIWFKKLFGLELTDQQVYDDVVRSLGFREYLAKKVVSKRTGFRLLTDTQRHYLESLSKENFNSESSIDKVYEAYKALKNRPNDWHLVHLSAGLYHLYIYKAGKKPKR